MPDGFTFSFYGKVKRIGIVIVQELETEILRVKKSIQRSYY